ETPRATSSESGPTGRLLSGARVHLDLNVRGRNCDRAVERSTPLEGVDEFGALLLGDSFEIELETDRVEKGNVRTHRVRAIHDAGSCDGNGAERNAFVSGDDLQELHTARGDAR